ncbi:RTA1 like protein-domain-containing protein [Scheffersomyces coipomensis]|uniref:RTA1 like protein-domain-containing protein n=1 Tax=Scheffersomyces coipomensis TaxID=1788519 RepID=UPI00315D2490
MSDQVNFSKFLPLIPSEYHTYLSSWSATSIPATKTLSYIAPTHAPALSASITSIQYAVVTETDRLSLYSLYRLYRGAQASLTIINNENMIATGTATQDFPEITEAIFNATLNLISLDREANLYSSDLSKVANLLMAVIFAIILIWQASLCIWSKHFYFGFCFICGTGLEFAGYFARFLAVGDYVNYDKFLCQIICLTLAPAFLMAGIYLLLAQLIVLHGRQYSILKPMWFSYVFIVCDLASLIIQAAGGCVAGIALNDFRNTAFGTHIMVGGIGFQVLSMSLFLIFLFDFIHRSLFKTGNPNIRYSVGNYLKCLFNTTGGSKIREALDPYYNPKHREIRQRNFFGLIPFVILISVIFVYIRCVYRVVELSQGWKGYLITHEQYVMTLDALMILLTSIILSVFHPSAMFGKDSILTFAYIKKEEDVEPAQYSVHSSPLMDEKHDYNSNHRQFKIQNPFRSYSIGSANDLKEADDHDEYRDTLEQRGPVLEHRTAPRANPFDDINRQSYVSSAQSNSPSHNYYNAHTNNNHQEGFRSFKYVTDETDDHGNYKVQNNSQLYQQSVLSDNYSFANDMNPSHREQQDLGDRDSFIFE